MSGRLVSINGIGLYHEVHGTGRPLVVLHGGELNAETCFGAMIARLAEAHQVIAVARRLRPDLEHFFPFLEKMQPVVSDFEGWSDVRSVASPGQRCSSSVTRTSCAWSAPR